MTKIAGNQGAFTVRPSQNEADRKPYFQLVDLLTAEVKVNRRLKKGPTSKTGIVLECLKLRYKDIIEQAGREGERKQEESNGRRSLFG